MDLKYQALSLNERINEVVQLIELDHRSEGRNNLRGPSMILGLAQNRRGKVNKTEVMS